MNSANSSTAPLDPSAGAPRYSPAQIALHWTIGLSIIIMLGIGLYMVGLPKDLPFKSSLISFHKSLGMTVFLLVLIRIVVRLVAGRPPLPPMPAWQRLAASMTQGLLYVAMAVMPVRGLVAAA